MRPQHLDTRAWLLMALCIASSASLPGVAASAQLNPVDLRAQEFERRTREQLEREQRLRLLEREATVQSEPAAPLPQSSAIEPCWQIRGLRLTGNTLLKPARLRTVLQSHLSACMGASPINQLLAALTALYVEAGYITSRPYLKQPPEDGQRLDIRHASHRAAKCGEVHLRIGSEQGAKRGPVLHVQRVAIAGENFVDLHTVGDLAQVHV